MTDLSKLSASELEDLVKEASQLAKERKEKEKQGLRDEIYALIQERGYSFQELFGPSEIKPVKQKRAKGEVKYRDPENPGNTWTGRGRKPSWLNEAEAAGRSVSEFEVK